MVRACSTVPLQNTCCQTNFPKFTYGVVTDSDRISQASVMRGTCIGIWVAGYNVWNPLVRKYYLNHDHMRTSCTVCIQVNTRVCTKAKGPIRTHTMCSKYRLETPPVSSLINTQFCFAECRPVHNSAETATTTEFNTGTWCLYHIIVFSEKFTSRLTFCENTIACQCSTHIRLKE